MNSKKKILVLLTRLPYPPVDGTRFKILNNIIQGLEPEFDLEFCIVTDDNVKESQTSYLRNNFGRLYLFRYAKWKFYLRALVSVFSNKPMQTGYYYFREVKKWLSDHAEQYDAIYVHTIRLGKYAEKISKVCRDKIVLDFNDAISLNYKDGKRFASPFWRAIYSIEESRIKNYEVRLLSEFEYFNVTSARDKRYILDNYSRTGFSNNFTFENIKHGIDSKVLNYHWKRGNNSLVFMGNLKYPPNTDAVRFFLEGLWPNIKKGNPSLKLVVIGDRGSLKFVDGEDVTFTGFVDDPYTVIAAGAVFVAPLRFGAGTPTKILEAMAIGIPVITTPLGVAGIEGVEEGRNIVVKDVNDVVGWVDSIDRLLSDAAYARQVSEKGRELVTASYTDKLSQERFRKLFEAITRTV
ncbi:MAG: glycosyltransferase family 4 protein [Patescibacteria group bacterium]|nr:glycosyltransferase family 4 protein [Patescibacteria group bacterium]MCL5224326.1 glycosyltransferase family 4 protein [Patescibacteria group bacterium]